MPPRAGSASKQRLARCARRAAAPTGRTRATACATFSGLSPRRGGRAAARAALSARSRVRPGRGAADRPLGSAPVPFASSPRMELGGALRGASTIGAGPSRTTRDLRRGGTGGHRLPGGDREDGAMAWEVRFFADRQAFGGAPRRAATGRVCSRPKPTRSPTRASCCTGRPRGAWRCSTTRRAGAPSTASARAAWSPWRTRPDRAGGGWPDRRPGVAGGQSRRAPRPR